MLFILCLISIKSGNMENKEERCDKHISGFLCHLKNENETNNRSWLRH